MSMFSRWLQLHPVVDRLVEQWSALKHYFFEVLPAEKPVEYNRNDRVASIKASMRNPTLELDLHFLKNILPVMVKFEKLYQRQEPLIHK
jgi:hypothetical protein